ncbi:MAG: MFS transporter, partial [Pseudomonadota bacterium]
MTEQRPSDTAPDISALPVSETKASWRAWWGIAIFAMISLLVFLDRQILILLAQPIKLDLGLSDLQLGTLQGLPLAFFGVFAGYPIGWLADRFDRRLVLAGCLALWGIGVVACGFAPGFWALFIASGIIGAGEAGLAPIVYSLIPEIVSKSQRQLANSIYTILQQFSYGIGSAVVALILGGVAAAQMGLPSGLAGMADWRLAFLVASLPVPVMIALLFTLRLRRKDMPEIERSSHEIETKTGVATHLRGHWRTMFSFYLGIGFAGFGFAAVLNWVPAILTRQYGMEPMTIGAVTGTVTIAATIGGFIIGTVLLRWLRPRFGIRVPIIALWTAVFSAAVTSALLFAATAPWQIFALQGIQYAFIIGAFLVYPTAIQDISPAPVRGRLISLLVIVRMV